MALRINTNISALNAHKNMIKNDSHLSSSLERLSTGLRINKAADDASGMLIADSLKAQHMGIGQAVRNANDGISIVQTADGALEESINIINTIKTKAIQAASDGQTSTSRNAIQNDIDKLLEELDVIARTTSFNGQKLLSGAFTNKSIQIGAFSRETASITIGSTESTKMGHITSADLSLTSDSGETQLTITSSITGEKLTLNSIDIQSNNNAENGMGALANEVNRYTAMTGIKATAIINSTSSAAISEGSTGSDFSINGILIGSIDVSNNDSDQSLVSAINGKTAEHGVQASVNQDGSLTLSSTDGRSIAVTGVISDVFNSTASQMSTIGYLNLTQSGVTKFQIEGIGAGATGADFTVTNAVTTVDDSVIVSGSTIGVGTIYAAGSTLGADLIVATSAAVSSSQGDYFLKAGSVLEGNSMFAKNTILGGTVTVDTGANETTEQDMLVTAGSTLAADSVLEQGTVVTTAFTTGAGGNTYDVGDVLTSDITLGSDLTLQSDMILEKDSVIALNSTLAAGTVAGMDIATSTSATTTLSQDMTLEAGSNIAELSKLLAGSITGDTTTQDTGATATTYQRTELASGSTIGAASVLAEGSTLGAQTVITTDTDLTSDMTVKAGSILQATSILAVGTIVTTEFTTGAGGTTYEVGDVLTSAITLGSDLTLSEDMTLKKDSQIDDGSTLAVNTANAGTVGLDEATSLNLSDLSVLTQEDAQNAIDIAESALAFLDKTRASLGSIQNQFVSTISNLSVSKTNIMASESAIRDVDFAEESMNFAKLQLLSQTGSYALAQANASSQTIMSLLQ